MVYQSFFFLDKALQNKHYYKINKDHCISINDINTLSKQSLQGTHTSSLSRRQGEICIYKQQMSLIHVTELKWNPAALDIHYEQKGVEYNKVKKQEDTIDKILP